MTGRPNRGGQKTPPWRVTEWLETTYQETGAGTGTGTGDGTGLGLTETEQGPHEHPGMSNRTTNSCDAATRKKLLTGKTAETRGVEGPAPAAGMDGPGARAAEIDAGGATAEGHE